MKKTLKQILQNLETENEHKSYSDKEVGAILAVDYGEKFTGLAWSPDGIVSLVIDVFPTASILKKITDLITKKNIKLVILGLPLSDSGDENENCRAIRTLGKRIKAPVTFVNERSSTQMTHGLISSKGNPRKDDLAAAQILEFWIQQKGVSSSKNVK